MMTFPVDAFDVMRQLYAKFPVLVQGDEDQRRVLIRICAEQIAYVLGARWGNKKRAGLGDAFRSKDSIAYLEDDGTCSVWDTQHGVTRALIVRAGSEPNYPHLPVSDATFMTVQPTDHLGLDQPVPDPGPSVPNPGTPDIGARLTAIDRELQLIRLSLAKLHEKPAPVMPAPVIVFPEYTGKLFGYTITLRPKGL